MRWAILLGLAVAACGNSSGDPEPGTLGGQCTFHGECTGTPGWRICRDGTCRAYCEYDGGDYSADCAAMGGYCVDGGACQREP